MAFDFNKPEYEVGSGTTGDLIKENEKNILIANAVPLKVMAVGRANTKFGARFAVQVELEGSDRVLMFPTDSVTGRANMLADFEDYFKGGGEPFSIKLVKREGSPAVLIEEA